MPCAGRGVAAARHGQVSTSARSAGVATPAPHQHHAQASQHTPSSAGVPTQFPPTHHPLATGPTTGRPTRPPSAHLCRIQRQHHPCQHPRHNVCPPADRALQRPAPHVLAHQSGGAQQAPGRSLRQQWEGAGQAGQQSRGVGKGWWSVGAAENPAFEQCDGVSEGP